ncbi:MAG: hypothetical protein ACREXP_29110 [Steroidobacteraceae bacterium]
MIFTIAIAVFVYRCRRPDVSVTRLILANFLVLLDPGAYVRQECLGKGKRLFVAYGVLCATIIVTVLSDVVR